MSTAGTANLLWNTKVRGVFVDPLPEWAKKEKVWAGRYESLPKDNPVQYTGQGTVSGTD